MTKMTTLYRRATGAATLLAALAVASPAMAGKLTERQRAVLEAQVRDGREVTRSYDDALRDYGRAAKAAEGIDATIGGAVRRVPGGPAAWALGHWAGKAGYDRWQKRQR